MDIHKHLATGLWGADGFRQAADFGATPRPVRKQIGSSARVSDSMVKVKVKMMVARVGIETPTRAFSASHASLPSWLIRKA